MQPAKQPRIIRSWFQTITGRAARNARRRNRPLTCTSCSSPLDFEPARSSSTCAEVSIRLVSSWRPLRAMNTRWLGSLIQNCPRVVDYRWQSVDTAADLPKRPAARWQSLSVCGRLADSLGRLVTAGVQVGTANDGLRASHPGGVRVLIRR